MTFLLGSQARSRFQVPSAPLPPTATEISALHNLGTVWRDLLEPWFSARAILLPPQHAWQRLTFFACDS